MIEGNEDIEAERVLFAIPKKGRLHEKCVQLLNGAGLEYNRVASFFFSYIINIYLKQIF